MMFFQGISEAVAGRALNSIPAGLAIAAVAWLGLKAFRRRGSRIAFAVWFLALVGIAAVPFVPPVEPAGAPGLSARVTVAAVWANVFFGTWLAVAGFAAMRLLVGIWKLWRLKREASPIS